MQLHVSSAPSWSPTSHQKWWNPDTKELEAYQRAWLSKAEDSHIALPLKYCNIISETMLFLGLCPQINTRYRNI